MGFYGNFYSFILKRLYFFSLFMLFMFLNENEKNMEGFKRFIVFFFKKKP